MNVELIKDSWERNSLPFNHALDESPICQICNKELIKKYHWKYPNKIISQVYLMLKVKGKPKGERLIACEDCAWKYSWEIGYNGDKKFKF